MTQAAGPRSMLSVLLLRPNHDLRRFFFCSLSVTGAFKALAVDALSEGDGGGLPLRRRDDGLDWVLGDRGL
jgi:hypothetical protein